MNNEIFETLQRIAENLNSKRTVTKYTSNEGVAAANNALYWLNKIEGYEYEKQKCSKELERAKSLHETEKEFNPSACPIAVQHAIELFLIDVGYKTS